MQRQTVQGLMLPEVKRMLRLRQRLKKVTRRKADADTCRKNDVL
jgi:hypothetical protein